MHALLHNECPMVEMYLFTHKKHYVFLLILKLGNVLNLKTIPILLPSNNYLITIELNLIITTSDS